MVKNYLQHDFGSRNNQVLLQVRRHYGMEGVGVYWCITEMLFESEGHMPLDIDLLSYDLRSESRIISGVIDISFSQKDGVLYSDWIKEELLERLEAYNKKIEGRSKAGVMSGIARRSKKLLLNKDEHVLNKVEHVFDCVEQNELSKDKLSYPKESEEKNRKVMLSEEKKTEYKNSNPKVSEDKSTEEYNNSIDNLFNF